MYYGNIKKSDIADGPGVRVSLFVSGCTHHCKGCFNEETMQVLHGRDVILIPDLGATKKWTKKSAILTSICKSVTISTVLEQMATDEQREAGLDISDFLLMQETKQMILQRMIERNPALQLLIDKLQLELVE